MRSGKDCHRQLQIVQFLTQKLFLAGTQLVLQDSRSGRLTHALKNVDHDEVLAVVRRTNAAVVALPMMLVAISYTSFDAPRR